jgi:hypothetical protein
MVFIAFSAFHAGLRSPPPARDAVIILVTESKELAVMYVTLPEVW